MAATAIDGILLLGFGGVTEVCCERKAVCPGRVECFIGKVLGDDPRMAGRIAEVAEHYHHLGGTSPYNELTFRQAGALRDALAERGQPLPVACGFRNWPPWYEDGLRELASQGCRRVLPLVLSLHQCSRSWQDYLAEAQAAAAELAAAGEAVPELVEELAPYYESPGFVEASVDLLRQATADWSAQRLAEAALVLTAHAIPQPAERASPYRQQVARSASAIATGLGHPEHHLAFQSAPNESRVPWSAPRVEDVVTELALRESPPRDLLVQSVGFLVDHVEVVFDLDTELREQAAAHGMTYTRARCVQDHPGFIGQLADRILARLADS